MTKNSCHNLVQVLVAIDKRFAEYILFVNRKIEDFKAVIATGTDNSVRYLEYYFGRYLHVKSAKTEVE